MTIPLLVPMPEYENIEVQLGKVAEEVAAGKYGENPQVAIAIQPEVGEVAVFGLGSETANRAIAYLLFGKAMRFLEEL